MSSNQQQQDLNLRLGLSEFNTQVVHIVFPINKQNSLIETLDRRESTPIKTSLSIIDNQLNRTSSAPPVLKLVGSNRFFVPHKK